MLWNFLSSEVPHSEKELAEILLKNRKIVDRDLFFSPPEPKEISIEDLGFDLEMIALAKNRILEAIEKKQKILIFGD